MHMKNFAIGVFIFASACVYGAHNFDYSDLEAEGVTCPRRDSCAEYSSNMSFFERNCECDSACTSYDDCCIDSGRSTSRTSGRLTARSTNRMCLAFGPRPNVGIYAINACSSNRAWPLEIRQKCRGSNDLTDPLNAAPLIATHQGITYRNRYCAECNNAESSSLTTFQILMNCDSLTIPPNNLTEKDIWNNIEYSASVNRWGVYRWSYSSGRREFYACEMVFDMPDYVTSGFRMCRASAVSSCPSSWQRPAVKQACESYTAVVLDNNDIAYKNPHCALCNGLTAGQLSCDPGLQHRTKKPLSFALLLDVNQNDGDQVGMTRQTCPSGQKYDPFFKRCRALVCALPGYTIVNGRCARSNG